MSTDQVKLGHLYAEIVSSHDVSRFDELVAPSYVNHNAFAEPGLEGVKKVFGAILAGVPDLKVFAEDVFDGTGRDSFDQIGFPAYQGNNREIRRSGRAHHRYLRRKDSLSQLLRAKFP